MTAIINCRHSTVKGGFGRIQQQRGKRKTERKPQASSLWKTLQKLLLKINKEPRRVLLLKTLYRLSQPSSTKLMAGFPDPLYHHAATQGGKTAVYPALTEWLSGAWAEPHNWNSKGFVMQFALIVLANTQLKYQEAFEKYPSETPLTTVCIQWDG